MVHLLPFLFLILAAPVSRGSPWPEKFTINWIAETGRSPVQSSLLKPIDLQEWSVTIDQQRGRLCAIRSTRGGGGDAGHEQYLLSQKLPLVTVVDPHLGIVIPFYLTDSNFFGLPIPHLSALERFWQAPQAEQAREGEGDTWRLVRFSRAWSMPLGPVPSNMDIVEHAGDRSGFTRWRLVSFSDNTVVVDDALSRCLARTRATADTSEISEVLTSTPSPLYQDGRTPTLLAMQSKQQVKGRIWDPPDHLVVESSAMVKDARSTTQAALPLPPRSILQRLWSVISAADGPRCPHYPTCSAYCVLATRKHGMAKGIWLTVQRLLEESVDFESSAHYRLIYHRGRWRVYDPVE